jgi:hypothetical protein
MLVELTPLPLCFSSFECVVPLVFSTLSLLFVACLFPVFPSLFFVFPPSLSLLAEEAYIA